MAQDEVFRSFTARYAPQKPNKTVSYAGFARSQQKVFLVVLRLVLTYARWRDFVAVLYASTLPIYSQIRPVVNTKIHSLF